MNTTTQKFVDAETLGEALGVPRRRVYSLASSGVIPGPIILGTRSHRWELAAVIDALKARAEKNKKHPN